MKSIRRRLTLVTAAGFCVLLIGSGAIIYALTRFALTREFDANLRAKAIIAMMRTEQSSSGIHFEPPPEADGDNDDAVPYCQLWETNGTSIYRSPSLRGRDLPLRFGSYEEPSYWDLRIGHKVEARAIGIQFRVKAEDEDASRIVPRNAILVVAASRRELEESLAVLMGVLMATGLIAVLCTIPIVYIAVRRGHLPLEAMARQAAGIDARSLTIRFPTDSMPQELQPIAARLNDVLERLENSFERERRFSADLAHELRTPLAELRTQAEVGLQFPGDLNTEMQAETLAIALQMQALVTSLLELARAETEAMPVAKIPVLLAPLMEEILRPLREEAGAHNLFIKIEIPGEAAFPADPGLLRSILNNIVGNAIAYAPAGGQIEIAWQAAPAQLTVSNMVDDLTPADLPHLFERLWRKDKSRTANQHAGLGLSISRAFAERLGLDLTARFTGEKRLTLFLRAPESKDVRL